MRQVLINKMHEVMDFPVYVFQKATLGFTCDRVTPCPDRPRNFKRVRYVLTGGQQCTCLGFTKGYTCKHIQMLKGVDDWIKSGVSTERATHEADRLTEFCKDMFPDSSEKWTGKGMASNTAPVSLPDLIKSITLDVTVDKDSPFHMLVSRKDFGEFGDMGITLRAMVPSSLE